MMPGHALPHFCRPARRVGRCYKLIVSLVLLIFLSVANGQSTCNRSSKFVGFKGKFVTVEHEVTGEVSITDACTAVINNFRWDGAPPASYFWCAEENNPDSYRAGSRAQLMKLPPGAYTQPSRVEVKLSGSMSHTTWDDCPILAVWCEEFSALLAYVVLKPTTTAPSLPVPPAAPNPAAATDIDLLASWNCVELVPKTYHMYWKVSADKKNISVALQLAAPTTGTRTWMAFGFSDPTKPTASMIGSDAVVAGFSDAEGAGFALDYHITNRDQCNYETGQDAGVCPDSGLANSPTANNAVLTGVDVSMGLITVTFTRPVAASDKFDYVWATDTASPAVWAYGPLSEKSTAQLPVVLYHGSTQRSDPSFKFNFGSVKAMCANKVMPMGSLGTGGPASKPGDPNAIKVINGRTMFVVRTGSNANYPNPPAWGYSFHVNDLESPVIEVVRGVEYTFSVQAGDSHPLYITTDIIGGSSNKSEKVFAGGLTSQGTMQAPFVFKWTPAANAPASLYYQCAVHQKFGWKVNVVDPGNNDTCSQTHPFVGFEGNIDGKEHGIKGTVTILDDCTVKISGFSYDGQAPAAEVYLATAANSIKQGVSISSRLKRSYNGEDLMLRLPAGASWDKYSVLSVWCVEFSADFGHVMLQAAMPKADVAGCELELNGTQKFDVCSQLTGLGAFFEVYLSARASGDKSMLKGAIVSDAVGWASFAIPKEVGKMVGASAIIVRQSSEGVKIDGYTLAERSVAGVKMPATGFTVRSSSAATTIIGGKRQLAGVFEIELEQPLSQLKAKPLDIIYAVGPASADGSLQIHSSRAAGTINLQTGAASGGKGSTKREALRVAHGYMMGLTWGVFIPIGITAAASFKNLDPLWFLVHHILNATCFLVGLAGFGIGLWLGHDNDYFYKKHYRIGIVVIIMGGLQALSGWLRPRNHDSKIRRVWNVFHWWNGRVAAVLAIVNVFEGFDIIAAPSGLVVAYWVVLGAILLVAVSKQGYDHVQQLPAGGKAHSDLSKSVKYAPHQDQGRLAGADTNGKDSV